MGFPNLMQTVSRVRAFPLRESHAESALGGIKSGKGYSNLFKAIPTYSNHFGIFCNSP